MSFDVCNDTDCVVCHAEWDGWLDDDDELGEDEWSAALAFE